MQTTTGKTRIKLVDGDIFPGCVAVRYTALADVWIDVYCDRNGRVFLAENND
jgi:hypothetical protein